MASDWDMDTPQITAVRAMVDTLIKMLVGNGYLTGGHEKILHKIGRAPRGHAPELVRLRVDDTDKHSVAGPDIDCASRLHLCKARCCSFSVTLTVQDLEEGGLPWDWATPYVLQRADDGYCVKLDRAGGGCTCYDRRPLTCRTYDCRNDSLVWLDFDKRIPAPMPEGRTSPPFTEE